MKALNKMQTFKEKLTQAKIEHYRTRFLQYTLLILLLIWIYQVGKNILSESNVVVIQNVIAAEKVEPVKPQVVLSIEDKIKQTFPEQPEIMLAVAKAESKLNPHATNINRNGTKDTGIFQVNSVHGYNEEWLKNEDNNLKAARKIYEKQGLKAWYAYQNGAYLKHLN